MEDIKVKEVYHNGYLIGYKYKGYERVLKQNKNISKDKQKRYKKELIELYIKDKKGVL